MALEVKGIKVKIEGKEVLDLYAGTGSFGLEALSRGAAGVVFVESAFKACRLLKENLKLLNAEENSSVMCAKVSQALESFKENGRNFNLIFVDPPFLFNLCQKTLDNLVESNLLKHNALIIVHHHQKEKVDSPSEKLLLIKSKKFGDNLVSIFLFSEQK